MTTMFLLCTLFVSLFLISIGTADSVHDFSAIDIFGNKVSLSKYKGKVLIIVNVASQCGYTDSNYKWLQKMYERFDGKLAIAAFPCNQFGKQEPWDEKEINKWVKDKYGVTFDLYSKVDVTGPNTHPLFNYLKNSDRNKKGGEITWNFDGKFLVGKNGEVIRRIANKDKWESVQTAIDSYMMQTDKADL